MGVRWPKPWWGSGHRRCGRASCNRPASPVVISVEVAHPNLLTTVSQTGVSAALFFVTRFLFV
jgi:hypothetical protein